MESFLHLRAHGHCSLWLAERPLFANMCIPKIPICRVHAHKQPRAQETSLPTRVRCDRTLTKTPATQQCPCRRSVQIFMSCK